MHPAAKIVVPGLALVGMVGDFEVDSASRSASAVASMTSAAVIEQAVQPAPNYQESNDDETTDIPGLYLPARVSDWSNY